MNGGFKNRIRIYKYIKEITHLLPFVSLLHIKMRRGFQTFCTDFYTPQFPEHPQLLYINIQIGIERKLGPRPSRWPSEYGLCR